MICILAGCALRDARAEWQPLELFREQFISSNFFAAFIPPNPTQWVRVEISENLTNWLERANVLTTRQTHLFGDAGARSLRRRFYRLSVPGISVLQARSRWETNAPDGYRFEFRIWPVAKGPLTGTITVTGGNKTVSNVRNLVSLEPVAEYDPDDFPDIQELFDAIAQATSPGKSVDCEVTYDRERSFPLATTFAVGSLSWRIYEISDFQILSSKQHKGATRSD